MFEGIEIGATGERSLVVEREHTSARWVDGPLLVFSTPEMIAQMEWAAVDAVDPLLPPGYRTVGTHLDISHIAATPLGSQVTARAELIEIDGRKLTFRVEARDQVGKIGEGKHERVIIEMERFLQKAASRGKGV